MPELAVIDSRSLPGIPVRGEVTIDSIERGVTVRGEVTFAWVGDCRRCLEPVEGASTVGVDEIFQVDAPGDSDILELVDDQVDLLALVRDAVLVGLPLAPLCRDDCSGPDPERYPTTTIDEHEAERATAEPVVDPRWGPLGDLRLDD